MQIASRPTGLVGALFKQKYSLNAVYILTLPRDSAQLKNCPRPPQDIIETFLLIVLPGLDEDPHQLPAAISVIWNLFLVI